MGLGAASDFVNQSKTSSFLGCLAKGCMFALVAMGILAICSMCLLMAIMVAGGG